MVLIFERRAIKTAEELKQRYEKQLDHYADALGRLTGKTVKEKILYSFALNQEIVL